MPTRYKVDANELRERYERQMNDPTIMSLQDEMSLVGARLDELLGRLNGTSVDYEALRGAMMVLRSAVNQGNKTMAEDNMNRIDEIINNGLVDSATWREIYHLVEARRKLTETEQRTLNNLGAMIPVDQVMDMIGKLAATMALHITDQVVLRTIRAEFRRVIGTSQEIEGEKIIV